MSKATMTTTEAIAVLQRSGLQYIGPDHPTARAMRGEDVTAPQAASRRPYAPTYAAAYIGGRPAAVMEQVPREIIDDSRPDILVDRFSTNPGADYFTKLIPGLQSGLPTPEFFTSGPLPRITGSGVDPAVLLAVPWPLRHSAAFSESAAFVLRCIEAPPDPDIIRDLQTGHGQAAAAAYWQRVSEWVTSRPDDNDGTGPTTVEEMIEQMHPNDPLPDDQADEVLAPKAPRKPGVGRR